MSDWIEAYLDYTQGTPTADIYRLWSAITAVSGALERRVWIQSSSVILYPNLYTLLVGAPGTGKTQAINPAADLWRASKDIHLSPDNMTRASLLDALEKSTRKLLNGTKLIEFHSMLVAADEFGVLCPAHDLEFLSVLNKLFDNPPTYIEERRHNKKLTEIMAPHMVVLAGTQPGFMASLLPDEAWSMGFTSRLIMIYSAEQIVTDLNLNYEESENTLKRDQKLWLVQQMQAMIKRIGRFEWDPDAAKKMQHWNRSGQAPKPEHSKLHHYTARRVLHALKLSMISSASRGDDMRISIQDVERSLGWMFASEDRMPDIFREMVNKSDSQVIDELHFFAWRMWIKDRKTIPGSVLKNFLIQRIHSEKIERLLDLCVKANILRKTLNMDTYVPVPKEQHGLPY